MKLYRCFGGRFFTPEVIREAVGHLRASVPDDLVARRRMTVTLADGDEWTHDNEDEFFADYRKKVSSAYFNLALGFDCTLTVRLTEESHSHVWAEGADRAVVLRVMDVFERHRNDLRLPAPPTPKPVVFIGHGRDPQWKDLKNHLSDQHGYAVEAYETGARAGHSIRGVLDRMARKSTFALLVMTGEDEAPDGLRARQNVVHECGLFQGCLGWDRAIVLLEDGTTAFSNLDGIQQIRFSKGGIRETFGDVVATLRREFRA